MPCTTILVGKKASNNGSTIIARNDDSPSGVFHVKKLVVVPAYEGEKTYKSINSHVEVKLPNKVETAKTIIYKVTSLGFLINTKIAIIETIFTKEFFKTVTLKFSTPS